MTVTEFIRQLVAICRSQDRPVARVDFEPNPEGLRLTFTFKQPDDSPG